MHSVSQSSARKMLARTGLEVRYERSFLIDLKRLEPTAKQEIQRFVLDDFFQLSQLQDLPEFRQLGASKIYYRFTLAGHLVSLERMGQIVKFLWVIRKPDL